VHMSEQSVSFFRVITSVIKSEVNLLINGLIDMYVTIS
jgi:NAD-specific glutamate dehydrogenase